jgi:NAD(P)-dependent dehydrogenase (short-subunit alcohol dehydrogenase family)
MASDSPRRAVITGVSSGIGRALAERMARDGWEVVGTARDVESVRAREWPDGVEIEELDLSRPESVALFIDTLRSRPAPDALVNNAGVFDFKALEVYAPVDLEALFRVNVLGPMQLTAELAPAFRERGSGVILNISSLSGIMLFPFRGAYGGTKHAVEALSEALWYELRPFGVRVKLVQPGFVDTPIWQKAAPPSDGVDRESPYGRLQAKAARLEQLSPSKEPCAKAAEEILRAVNDQSFRFRYPICKAGRFALLRRLLGPDLLMRLEYRLWMRR